MATARILVVALACATASPLAAAPDGDTCSLPVARWQAAEPAGRNPDLDGYNRLGNDAVLAATLCEAGRPADALRVLDGTTRSDP